MKTKILKMIFIVVLAFFTSCNNTDDAILDETIMDVWNLKNVSGGFLGVEVNYENGSVTWEFVSETNKLIVESSIMNNGPQSVYLPLQSGNYNYTLIESNGKTFIIIEGFETFDNGEYGRYEINDNDELVINQGEGSEANASDVFTLLFD